MDERTGRDFEKEPYSKDERRIAEFFHDIGVGGGDDPVGFVLASHAELARQRNLFKARLHEAGLSTDSDEEEEAAPAP